MTQGSYKQFCPVAMAAEILCTRWTLVLIREMLAGSTRFNDLRRGLPRMSPALLSQRLKELEHWGVVKRVKGDEGGLYEYHLTKAGMDLQPVVEHFGCWGQRWIESKVSLDNLDVQLLMWDMRRSLDLKPLPRKRSTIQFQYPDAPTGQRMWWLVVAPGSDTDLCSLDPELRRRPLCVERPEDDDLDLDGHGDRASRGQQRLRQTRWRQAIGVEHADVAGLEPVREREAHGGLRRR